MRMRRFIATALLTGFLAGAGLLGCSESPEVERSDLPPKARASMDQGRAALRQNQWNRARTQFHEAWKVAQHAPEVLYYLGRASGQASHGMEAIAWYRAYLAAARKAPNAEAVRARIGELEEKVKATIRARLRVALEGAGALSDPKKRDDAYEQVVGVQADIGDIAEAKATAAWPAALSRRPAGTAGLHGRRPSRVTSPGPKRRPPPSPWRPLRTPPTGPSSSNSSMRRTWPELRRRPSG